MHRSHAGVSQIPRAIDLLLAGLMLLLFAPVMAAIALALRLEGRGPVLYREPRVGKGGRQIEVVKFRTLHPGGHGGRRVVPADHPGVTRVGRPLRHTHLDELPQLLAVVRGGMSLIGPRPEREEAWAALEPHLREPLLALRPGMTSPAGLRYLCEDAVLAQCADPDRLYHEVLVPTKFSEDLEYFRRRTLGTDVRLLGRTLTRTWLGRRDHDCHRRVLALLAGHLQAGPLRSGGGRRP